MNENQINTELVRNSLTISDNLFWGSDHITIMSNNIYELIRYHQQGGILIVIKRESVKLIRESGMDQSGLG